MTDGRGRAPGITALNIVLMVPAAVLAHFFTVLDSGRTGGHVEAIGLDRRIPFWPGAVLPYMSIYVLLVLTAVILARGNPWRLTVFLVSFILLWGVADLCWSLYPTVNVIRPDHLGDGWLDRLVRFNYGPGRDTLPSGHNMTAWLCAFTLIAERVRHAWLFAIWAAAVSASTLLVRQHYLVDVAVSVPAAYLAVWVVDHAITRQRQVGQTNLDRPA